jgi:nucleotide-binding universal stress UspA family protein
VSTVANQSLVNSILVVLDGSANVLDEAVRIAREANARLTVASVVAPTPAWAFAGRFAVPFTPDDLRRACEREAEAEIARARASVPDGVSLTTRILRGRASSALVDEALAGGYDLVVAGSRAGRRARLLRRRCPVPVLVVPRA